MGPVLTEPRPALGGRRRLLEGIAAGAAVVVLLMVTWLANDSPSFVDRVTVVNRTEYSVEAEVAGRGERGWLGLGTVEHGRSATFEQVVDQGTVWVFRFSYGDVPGGEIVVDRPVLERQGWRIEVPAQVATRLRAAGLGPSA
jgi:hypothetical protein